MVGGVKFAVRKSTDDDDPALKGNWGYCCIADSEIVLDKSMKPEQARYILEHELCHAAFEKSGLGYILKKELRNFLLVEVEKMTSAAIEAHCSGLIKSEDIRDEAVKEIDAAIKKAADEIEELTIRTAMPMAVSAIRSVK